jgi:hypothetical protein
MTPRVVFPELFDRPLVAQYDLANGVTGDNYFSPREF